MHLLGLQKNKLISYLRLFPENYIYPNSVTFGRIATSPSARGTGAGRQALQQTLSYLEKQNTKVPLLISAQCYLKAFYESFGFTTVDQPYDEDGIPHIQMRKIL
jgi:ElaA protein